MTGNRLRDVIMLVYAVHVFGDCWKLSLNVLYFGSKSCKELYFIGNIYDNIKSSSEGGCRLIKNLTMTAHTHTHTHTHTHIYIYIYIYSHTTQSLTHKSTLFLSLVNLSPLSLSFLPPSFLKSPSYI